MQTDLGLPEHRLAQPPPLPTGSSAMAADLGSGPRAQELRVDMQTRGAEKQRSSVRCPRTQFSPQQLGALRAEFEKTMHPSWATVLELTASTGLEEAVIQIWFKNQRARVRRQQAQSAPGPALEHARQGSMGEEVLPSPTTSDESGFPDPGPWGAAAQELPAMSTPERPVGPRGSGYPCLLEILPPDLQDLCLQASYLPWACSPLGVDELAQAYGFPGGEDPASLEQYLVPSAEPEGGAGPDLPSAAQGPCPTTSANTRYPSPGSWGVDAQELWALSSPEQHTGPKASGCPCPWDVLPPDLQGLCLQASHLPWAGSPLGVDELAEAYGSPGDEDQAGLEQYLVPRAEPEGDSGPDLPCAAQDPCPITSANTWSSDPGSWGFDAQELLALSSPPQTAPWASGCPCPWDILPPDLHDLCLQASHLPWAVSSLGIDELAQAYGSPGDEDLDSLDQYLFPSAEPDRGSGPDLHCAAQGPCPTTSVNTRSPSPGSWEVDAQELLALSFLEPHIGLRASGCPCPWDVLPPDLQDLCLQASHLPWAGSPLGVDELAQAYGSPGVEDPAGLDLYLVPSVEPEGGSGPDLSGAPPGPCPDRLHDLLLELLQSFAHTSEMNSVGTTGLEWLLGFQ